ncbi:MAG: HlyD family efflux transporter periplasmic adaptor subunit [Xanthobacteraceae bacterium]
MEEAVDQRSSIVHPPLRPTERMVTMAHCALADTIRTASAFFISALVLDSKRDPIAVITFERHGNQPFDLASLRLAEGIATLLGPYIALQLRTNKLFAGRVVNSLADGLSALLGSRRPGYKLAAIAVGCLVLFLGFAKGEHRVAGKAVLEGEVQRAAVAPFDGFIKSAPVRAGFRVKEGDLLAQLEDRDLVLDRLKWRAERDKLLQKRHEALAKHDRANLVVLGPQIEQAESQLALAEDKLARTRLLAPFDAIIVSGDLSQMLGSPVDKGKVLFELAPLDAYRLIVQVDERDVRYVAANQHGIVAFAGMPSEPLPVTLTTITPITTVLEGNNSFRVEAKLMQKGPNLRPGMEGVAKIDSGQRALLWVWTHATIDWVRLAAWKYLP